MLLALFLGPLRLLFTSATLLEVNAEFPEAFRTREVRSLAAVGTTRFFLLIEEALAIVEDS